MQNPSNRRRMDIVPLLTCVVLIIFALYVLVGHPQTSYQIYPTMTIVAIVALIVSIITGAAIIYSSLKRPRNKVNP